MTKEDVEARKKQTQDEFDQLEERKKTINKELDEINVEQLRLQGEFRLVQELEDTYFVETEEATTIKAVEKVGKKNE